MGLSPFPTLGGGKWKLRWKNREAKPVFGVVPDFQLNKNCTASFFKVWCIFIPDFHHGLLAFFPSYFETASLCVLPTLN